MERPIRLLDIFDPHQKDNLYVSRTPRPLFPWPRVSGRELLSNRGAIPLPAYRLRCFAYYNNFHSLKTKSIKESHEHRIQDRKPLSNRPLPNPLQNIPLNTTPPKDGPAN